VKAKKRKAGGLKVVVGSKNGAAAKAG